MDVEEYWDSRILDTKNGNYHHFSPARLDSGSNDIHLSHDDSDGDDDSRACIPCPYCYVDIEFRFLCMHLQEEHCFDMRNAVCPLCAANLGRDMTGHFMIQHSHLIKMIRHRPFTNISNLVGVTEEKPKKLGLWANTTPIMGRDLEELTFFLGTKPISNRENTPDLAPDPLLSPFISNISHQTEAVGHKTNLNSPSKSASTLSDVNSKLAANGKDVNQDFQEKKIQRAEFIQHLLLSTIF